MRAVRSLSAPSITLHPPPNLIPRYAIFVASERGRSPGIRTFVLCPTFDSSHSPRASLSLDGPLPLELGCRSDKADATQSSETATRTDRTRFHMKSQRNRRIRITEARFRYP